MSTAWLECHASQARLTSYLMSLASCNVTVDACFKDVAVLHNVPSVAACCQECYVRPDCNAYSASPPAKLCILKACSEGHTCATSSNPTRTSGWIEDRNTSSIVSPSAIRVQSFVTLRLVAFTVAYRKMNRVCTYY